MENPDLVLQETGSSPTHSRLNYVPSGDTLRRDAISSLFGVLRKGRGNQYIQFVRVLYCKLPTNGKQLPAFPHEAVPGIKPRPQRWEARVLPLCHRGPPFTVISHIIILGKSAITHSKVGQSSPNIFPLSIGYSCTTLWVKNSLEIALSLTVCEIFVIFH